jgi:hypothetical protein
MRIHTEAVLCGEGETYCIEKAIAARDHHLRDYLPHSDLASGSRIGIVRITRARSASKEGIVAVLMVQPNPDVWKSSVSTFRVQV